MGNTVWVSSILIPHISPPFQFLFLSLSLLFFLRYITPPSCATVERCARVCIPHAQVGFPPPKNHPAAAGSVVQTRTFPSPRHHQLVSKSQTPSTTLNTHGRLTHSLYHVSHVSLSCEWLTNRIFKAARKKAITGKNIVNANCLHQHRRCLSSLRRPTAVMAVKTVTAESVGAIRCRWFHRQQTTTPLQRL